MQMENVCYGREELFCLNMVRQGVLGELLHGEAAYIHELRGQMNEVEHGTGSWRTYHYVKAQRQPLPDPRLGPVAQYMSIGAPRTPSATSSSFSSPATGPRALRARRSSPPTTSGTRSKWNGGDMNTTIIKTALGRTIMVQWDETSPRPYSRHNLIQGTKGTFAGFPNRLAIEGVTSTHEWTEGEELETLDRAGTSTRCASAWASWPRRGAATAAWTS